MGKCRNDRQAIISDEQIIDLYREREERAIQATDDKYGHFLYGIAYNILHDHRNAGTTHTLIYGTPSRRQDPLYFRHLYQRSCAGSQ